MNPEHLADLPSSRAETASSGLTRLLSHHFGDRSIYILDDEDRALFPRAVAMGLVSDEGYLTHLGYQLWQHAQA